MYLLSYLKLVGAKILIIDHNDSFTYNLVGLFERLPEVEQVTVVGVDDLEKERLDSKDRLQHFDTVVLSPGPGLPADYPQVTTLLDHCFNRASPMPVLGICLGMQTLATYFGGQLYNLRKVQHGRQVALHKTTLEGNGNKDNLFNDISAPLLVGLYHSWAVDLRQPIIALEVLATAQVATLAGEGPAAAPIVMALRHKTLPAYGLQFHPESYMSPSGPKIIQNWLHQVLPSTQS